MINSIEIEKIPDFKIKDKKREGTPFNASFLTLPNIKWWRFVSKEYIVPPNKEIIFLPCAGAHKTRDKVRSKIVNGIEIKYKDPRKFISESMSHNCMKKIRETPFLEKIILSEPLTIIPYSLEANEERPDYNLPCDYLSMQGEFIFIDRLSHFLLKLKLTQPYRQNLFYFGGSYHYLILYLANDFTKNILNKPAFNIVSCVPPGGTKDYSKYSQIFVQDIKNMIEKNEFPHTIDINLEKERKKRGRYTHKPFIKALIDTKWIGKNKNDLEMEDIYINIAEINSYKKGFSEFYAD